MPRYPALLSALCLGLALVACERRPTEPPKPSTVAELTPAIAGLAAVGTDPNAKPPHGPASDPPPVPQPAPRPPSAPASAASTVMR